MPDDEMPEIVQYIIMRKDILRTLNWPLDSLLSVCTEASNDVMEMLGNNVTNLYFGNLISRTILLDFENEAQLVDLSNELTRNDILHKVRMVDNIRVCLAIMPMDKRLIANFVSHLQS